MQGQKTPLETIYQIMGVWAITGSYAETSRILDVPASTVEKIVKEHKDEPEFVKLCGEKRNSFADKADDIIKKAMNRLERELDNEEKEIPVNHLTTAIGTLYDKKALAEGKPTNNVNLIPGTTVDKLAELAGYEKRQ